MLLSCSCGKSKLEGLVLLAFFFLVKPKHSVGVNLESDVKLLFLANDSFFIVTEFT